MSSAARPVPAVQILRAVATTTLAVIPVALVASFSLLIRADLDFTPYRLALVVAFFYVASALTAFAMGRYAVAERLGPTRTTCTGLTLTAASLTSCAVSARTWPELGLCLALGGVGNGLIQPTANLALTRRVEPGRLGLAFGVKQAAVPGATFLAGTAAAATGILPGWRWAFLTFAGVALGTLCLEIALDRRRGSAAHRGPLPRRLGPPSGAAYPLTRLVLAGALGSVANNAMRVFFVESAVARGQSLAAAGTILGVGSVAGILTRLFGGWRSDRSDIDPVRSAALLMVLGAVGYSLMAWAEDVVTLGLASVLGIAAGWGWAGLLQLGLVRAHPERAGAASGFLHSSTLTGSLVGPILFGLVAQGRGYPAGWLVVGVFGLLAGVVLLTGRSPSPAARISAERGASWRS